MEHEQPLQGDHQPPETPQPRLEKWPQPTLAEIFAGRTGLPSTDETQNVVPDSAADTLFNELRRGLTQDPQEIGEQFMRALSCNEPTTPQEQPPDGGEET